LEFHCLYLWDGLNPLYIFVLLLKLLLMSSTNVLPVPMPHLTNCSLLHLLPPSHCQLVCQYHWHCLAVWNCFLFCPLSHHWLESCPWGYYPSIPCWPFGPCYYCSTSICIELHQCVHGWFYFSGAGEPLTLTNGPMHSHACCGQSFLHTIAIWRPPT
jgi:hypothetical protein